MYPFASRVGRWPLALTLVALVACVDEPAAPRPTPRAVKPNVGVGTIITVTNKSGGTGVGSLRWAVAQATGGETIQFDPSLAGDTIFTDSTVVVPWYVTIEGNRPEGITIHGGGRGMVMRLIAGGTLRNVQIKGGYAADGAGIFAHGPLTLEHSSVYKNIASVGVGGILALSGATLINSTVGLNQGPTVSGISYAAPLTLIHTTVAQNYPGAGVEPWVPLAFAPRVTLRNSIIAGNGDYSGYWNCRTSQGFVYEGMNLSDDTTCGFTTGIVVADPLLNYIYDYGGPGATGLLDHRSPAINAGANCTLTVDERYVPRDEFCDIGSFEFTDFNTIAITIDPTAAVNRTNGSAVVTGTVKCKWADVEGIGVRVQLQQKNGKEATSSFAFRCTGAVQPWSVTLVPSSSGFSSGTGTATASTNDLPGWYKSSTTSRTVKLTAK